MTPAEQLRQLQAELFAEEMKLALMKQVQRSQSSETLPAMLPGVGVFTVAGSYNGESGATAAPRVSYSTMPQAIEPQPVHAFRSLPMTEMVLPPPPPLREIRHRHPLPTVLPTQHHHRASSGQQPETTDVESSPRFSVACPQTSCTDKSQNPSSPAVVNAGSSLPVDAEQSVRLANAFQSHQEHVKRLAEMERDLDDFLGSIRPTLPPQYEWAVVPSLKCDRFRVVLGLEECVRELEAERLRSEGLEVAGSADSAPVPDVLKPRCRICHTDYAPFWRSFMNDQHEMVVVCENCDWMRVKIPFVRQHGAELAEALEKAERHRREKVELERRSQEQEKEFTDSWQLMYGSGNKS